MIQEQTLCSSLTPQSHLGLFQLRQPAETLRPIQLGVDVRVRPYYVSFDVCTCTWSGVCEL